jgi:GT2 family glycosyltransferase
MSQRTMSILLSTYKRPHMLSFCLEALLRQSLTPEEICVGRRENDVDSARVLAKFAERSGGLVREAVVGPEANLVASMNAALKLTTGDLVALTDDDAEAPADWLDLLATRFEDPTVGGVGGRDYQGANQREALKVGQMRWYGRLIGNHHLGVGGPRDVEVLKGVNCCFRGEVLRCRGFDTRMRGRANVSHWEISLCCSLLKDGWRLIYDPAIAVTHHVAVRHDGDTNARGVFEEHSFKDAVHNETLALLEHLPIERQLAFRAWAYLIGTRAAPGLLQVPRLALTSSSWASEWKRWRATTEGRKKAWHTWREGFSTPNALNDSADTAEPLDANG